ncbi:MAG: PHP domain-containing protein [Ruminococcaceae bacterium]|nr:PHP domain-containing protein [Oscillospiraceae bacterium]
MFKLETHCHTSEVSVCGKVSACDIVDAYIEAGYSGIVITDHFNRVTFLNKPELKTREIADYFLTGYRAAREAAKGRIDVLLGMELTFYENDNDYLVYGVTEKFIKKNPNIMDMGIERFSKLARDNGMIIFQAHPLRNHMCIINPSLLDGYEVFNANARHDSRNDVVQMWAQKFGKAMSSGSDYHRVEDLARGGIITEKRIVNNTMLKDALLGSDKELIKTI